MPDSPDHLRHIIVRGTAQAEEYTSPGGFPRFNYPTRERGQHAQHLLGQLNQVKQFSERRQESLPVGAPAPDGIYLEVDGKPGFDLKIQSLNLPSQGIELLSVKKSELTEGEKVTATIFVPQDKIAVFIKKVEEYRDQETRGGSPKNKPLVESVSDLRIAVVQSLWTDLAEAFPAPEENIWWEIWLRATADSIPRFQSFAQARDITLSQRTLMFPDRHVLLAHTSVRMLSESIESLGFIAELRRAKETTAEFLRMDLREQNEWVRALSGLLDMPSAQAPSVCILDTGIRKQHTLIDPFLPQAGMHTCNPAWNVDDHDGHGTEMAGIALFGNLENLLQTSARVQIPATLESVKILPPTGQNSPELYGSITEEAVSRATLPAPDKERVICMAITSTDDRDRGQPSSWSAAVDQICSGQTIAGKRHLFLVSGGNVEGDHLQYPNTNLTESVHDPGQSWNALTIGAYTEKDTITDPNYSGWFPLAPVGDIAPASTTSVIWERGKWPIKPDVVFEGGNAAIDSTRSNVDYPDSLALLTTGRDTSRSLFTWFADTSAATAQGANFAASIAADNSELWPETLRALMIHSAEWTPRMRQAYPANSRTDRESLLRTCGYGVPNLVKAKWSAKNVLTLIAQDELQPFEKNSMKEMNLHTLPWPTDALRALGEATVRMKVTLSYFIEPNPARRGWEQKFRYQSHGLRFDVKTPLESAVEFRTRLNRERWDEERGRASVTSSSDTDEWFLGRPLRTRGSLHCDWWEGSAASLADRALIAVYPVIGWWRERHTEGHTSKQARYSLVVTIETDDISADIYTPVKNLVSTRVPISR